LLLSVLLFPPPALAETGWLTALGAVATAEVVAAWTGLDARIKWPNDVRVDGRKIAGVLVERGAGIVIGIGLNANLTTGDLPPELHASATSLRILSDQFIDRSELARALIARLDHWYEVGRTAGPASLSPRWRALNEHLGTLVRVSTAAGDAVGRLDDVDLARGVTLSLPGERSAHIAGPDILSLATVAQIDEADAPDSSPANP